MRKPVAIPLVVSLLTAGACHQPGLLPVEEEGADVIAHIGELEITTTDLDGRILALPPAERPKPGEDLDAWYEEQIRELAIEHRLRAEAEAANLAGEESFITVRTEAEKQLSIQLCLADLRPEIENVTAADLRTAYEARAEDFSAPERRAAYHLFLRHDPGASPGATRAEISLLRDRVLAGESFQRLAATHSDSESRHRKGTLDWVTPGQLPAGFEEVIFSLEEGVPSEPVATREGVHLFYVDQILPPRQLTFDEVRPHLRERLVAERRQAALVELEVQIEPPPDALLLDRARFRAVAEAGDQEAVVLRLGDTELTLADFRRRLRQSLERLPEAGRPALGEVAWTFLEELRRRELLYGYCRTHAKIPAAELEARLETWEKRALLDAQRQRRLLEIAGRDEERLRLFYESNIGLFSSAPRWQLRRLRIPIGDDGPAVMARLEKAAAEGSSTLEELRSELGGEIEDLGLKTLGELRRAEPKLPPLVAPLSAGELSPPYRIGDTLEIVESMVREEAEPRPFDEVRERVAALYVGQYTREVYRELADEILRSVELEISLERFAALREAGLPRPEVSVEELENLLSEL